MKICWDNLENIYLTRNGNFNDSRKKITYYLNKCKNCNNEFLGSKKSIFCSKSCANSFNNTYDRNNAKKDGVGEKIRQSKLGKKRLNKTKKKISESLKGRKLSNETKKKISKSLKGKYTGKNSPNWKCGKMIKKCLNCDKKFKGQTVYCSIDCFSIVMSKRIGKNNPNWKGGISENLYCSGWKYLSKELREEDGKCLNPMCENKSNRLTSHHIDYNKQNCNPSNLITICHSCNLQANSNREWWNAYYIEIKRRMVD